MSSQSDSARVSRDTRDAELVRRISASDEVALHDLADIHAQSLFHAAMPVTGSSDLAQDAVQDTFIWLWDNRVRLSIKGSVISYLIRAVRNRAESIMRHEDAQYRLEANIHGQHNHEEPLVDHESEAGIMNAERTALIEAAINELTPRTRDVLLLRIDSGLSYREIADALGITTSTVKNQLQRAMASLAKRLTRWRDVLSLVL